MLVSCISSCYIADIFNMVPFYLFFFFLMIRRPPRSTQSRSSAASDVYKRQLFFFPLLIHFFSLFIFSVFFGLYFNLSHDQTLQFKSYVVTRNMVTALVLNNRIAFENAKPIVNRFK
eukprot:TRINITY_DN3907_c0_g1_i2.p1 TRINITY_DN3907_c0_g1~~TRINITY_DN3907_c0_g1_i2.p1  ORF type:complete len:117 (-),score=25.03 TRINITY_DN3907_c0_g1_i2:210-560(-)